MLKKPFGAVLSILQSWEFSKISPQNPGNGISETLDSKIFWGSMPPYPLEFLASSVLRRPTLKKLPPDHCMCVTLTESWGNGTCSVVVNWTRRSWQLAEHQCCDKTCERRKHARGENAQSEKTRERRKEKRWILSPLISLVRVISPALRVLSSQLSVSVMRIHVAFKTGGVSRIKLWRIAILIWSTI